MIALIQILGSIPDDNEDNKNDSLASRFKVLQDDEEVARITTPLPVETVLTITPWARSYYCCQAIVTRRGPGQDIMVLGLQHLHKAKFYL